MKRTLILFIVLVLTIAAAAGCSKKVESTPSEASSASSSVPSITTPSQSIAVGDNFVAKTFEINAKSTTDWVKYKSLSEPIAVRFSLWIPPDWTAGEDGTTFTDTAGRIVCEVLAPVILSDTQELPDVPGEKDTSNGTISSTADVGLSNMRGKCIVRQITENSATVYLHQYFMLDDDIVYRVNFRSYTGEESDRNVFNAIMDRLVNGK
jgi:hypothetical protein